MKMNQKAKFRIGVLVYLLLCIVLYVCIYVVPKVSDIFVETYVAEYGSLQIGEESEALFVRNERLYTADGGGAIDRVISGGSLMRKGSRIVIIVSDFFCGGLHVRFAFNLHVGKDLAFRNIRCDNRRDGQKVFDQRPDRLCFDQR